MRYMAYDTFIDYLFSQSSKTDSYDGMYVWMTTSGTFSDFMPNTPKTNFWVPLSKINANSVASGTFTYPQIQPDYRPEVLGSNGLNSESDKTYEEVLNKSAFSLRDRSEYLTECVKKAFEEAEFRYEDWDPTEDPNKYIDRVREELAMSTGFVQEEFDAYSVPQEDLNSDTSCVVAEDVTLSGKTLTLASGCLIGLLRDDQVCPIGFIDFQRKRPCTRYELQFDPQGFLKLK